MQLSPETAQTLKANFYNNKTAAYDTNSTLSITTYIYNRGDYRNGNPPVSSVAWVFTPGSLDGEFTCSIPASAIGPGPMSPSNVFPLVLVTIGLASDLVTVRFKDVTEVFPKPSTT